MLPATAVALGPEGVEADLCDGVLAFGMSKQTPGRHQVAVR